MKVLRAGLIGVVLWVLIFFEVSALMFGFKLTSGPVYYTIHYIMLVLFSILGVLWYFWNSKLKKGFLHGLEVGLTFVIVGIILDSIITIPLWIVPQGGSYSGFFFDKYMLIGYLIILIASGIVGMFKK